MRNTILLIALIGAAGCSQPASRTTVTRTNPLAGMCVPATVAEKAKIPLSDAKERCDCFEFQGARRLTDRQIELISTNAKIENPVGPEALGFVQVMKDIVGLCRLAIRDD